MRAVTLSKKVAYDVLSPKLAEAFFSVVADMRDATFLGELPDQPEITQVQNGVRLQIALQPGAFLEVEPLGKAAESDGGWKSAHRVKLHHVNRNGEILV